MLKIALKLCKTFFLVLYFSWMDLFIMALPDPVPMPQNFTFCIQEGHGRRGAVELTMQ